MRQILDILSTVGCNSLCLFWTFQKKLTPFFNVFGRKGIYQCDNSVIISTYIETHICRCLFDLTGVLFIEISSEMSLYFSAGH